MSRHIAKAQGLSRACERGDKAMSVTYLHFDMALLPGGWASNVGIEVERGFIRNIASDVNPVPAMERHKIGLPGMPNLHSHAFQRGFAGLAERRVHPNDDFWAWREIMYRFVDRISPDDLEAIAAQAFVEMLEGGFTQVGEFHYLHRAPDGTAYDDPATMGCRIAAAAESTGMGLTLLPSFYAHSGFGGAPPQPNQRRFISTPDEFGKLVEGCARAVGNLTNGVIGIAPHSLRAVTPGELVEILPLAKHSPIHIHVAEQVREAADCAAWCGKSPVAWLMENAPVDSRWCLVHATHADQVELRSIAASGAVVGLCPITEANLGDGLFPLSEFLECSGRMGIGSDSNVLIDCAQELRLLEYGQRLASRSRNIAASAALPSVGRFLFEKAGSGGAQALGIKWGLDLGSAADIIALDGEHPALACRSGDALLDSYIFAGAGGIIEDVWRAGKKVVSNGRHLRRDAVIGRYRNVLGKLLLS
jgi:formimidoylglutamate deiminase